jgi:TRAP-type C4-dicarboxylate transport system substrate-binding protein
MPTPIRSNDSEGERNHYDYRILIHNGMSSSFDPEGMSSIHLVNGSDPQLLGLFHTLQAAGLNTLLVDGSQLLSDVVEALEPITPPKGFSAVHVYGHGQPGAQDFGRDPITGDNLASQQSSWQRLVKLSQADADLLLYGCGVGADQQGSLLLDQLAALTGMDVAASDDITGRDDWELEQQRGSIEHSAPTALQHWNGRLKTVSPSWMNVLSEKKEQTLVDAIAGQRGDDLRRASFMGYHLTNLSGSDNNAIEALTDFWDRVKQRTNGRLNMTVLASHANVPGSDNEALLGVANGRFDAITAAGPIYSGLIPQVANIINLLFAYSDTAEGRAVVNDPAFRRALLEAGKAFQLRFLTRGTLNPGMRAGITTVPDHPINSIDDLNGFKLRIPPSTPVQQQLKALGVEPIQAPFSQIAQVLTDRVAWGQENPASYIQTLGLKDIVNQFTLINHKWSGFLTAINLETWESWPKQWQRIVLSEQNAMQAQQWTAQDAINDESLATLEQDYGITVVNPTGFDEINSNAAFVTARNQVIKTLAPSLRPLARAVVSGYYTGR